MFQMFSCSLAAITPISIYFLFSILFSQKNCQRQQQQHYYMFPRLSPAANNKIIITCVNPKTKQNTRKKANIDHQVVSVATTSILSCSFIIYNIRATPSARCVQYNNGLSWISMYCTTTTKWSREAGDKMLLL